MTNKKKRKIRKLIQTYRKLLGLNNYRLLSRFVTAREDKEMKDAYAVVSINGREKRIYIKLNSFEFNRMKMQAIRKLILHELLHTFFSELNDLFEELLRMSPLQEKKKERLKKRSDEVEHQKISLLIRDILRLQRYRHKLHMLEKRR